MFLITSFSPKMLKSFRSCFVKYITPAKYQVLVKEPRNEDAVQPTGWNSYVKVLLFIIFISVFMMVNIQNVTYRKSHTFLTTAKTPGISNKSTSHLKYILLWKANKTPVSKWKLGQREFIAMKCSVTNCYISRDRGFFGSDVTQFDAVIFNGRNLKSGNLSTLPQKRSPHQKYIFLNMESADNQPICSPIFDGFFNWTATYKLNSDIEYSYIKIRDAAGKTVGPRVNMTWIDPMSPVNNSLLSAFENKTLAAAWFVSHCYTRNKRLQYAKRLKKGLEKFNLTLDIYGKCGELQCERVNESHCEEILRKKYYFYLSFENSFTEDYVTEKLMTALHSDAVPIVYGGAQYSRFLPPGSYINAMLYQPEELASVIASIIRTPAVYYEFFRWRHHYSYSYPDNLCRLCAALHDRAFDRHSVYKEFRRWWNPDYITRCNDITWGS